MAKKGANKLCGLVFNWIETKMHRFLQICIVFACQVGGWSLQPTLSDSRSRGRGRTVAAPKEKKGILSMFGIGGKSKKKKAVEKEKKTEKEKT